MIKQLKICLMTKKRDLLLEYPKKVVNIDLILLMMNLIWGKKLLLERFCIWMVIKDILKSLIIIIKKFGLNAIVKNIPEYRQPRVVYKLLKMYKPDILIITGHDGMIKRGTNFNDVYNYRNSRHFINTVKEARRYDKENNTDTVIFAGACQSYFEGIMMAGANFASSPARILIDFLDPLIIAEKVATTEKYKFITVDEVIKEIRDGRKGIGGIGSNGKMVVM